MPMTLQSTVQTARRTETEPTALEPTSSVPVQEVLAELDKVLGSETFRRARRLRDFLRFVVERAVSGDFEELREYRIGREVFEKPDEYDTRIDPLVRVEAGRLRAKLREYYDTEGPSDAIGIALQKRGYRPSFTRRTRHPQSQELSSSSRPHSLVVESSEDGRVVRDDQVVGGDADPSVLVLPFIDLSPKGNYGYLCDGITVEIINRLAKVNGLNVVARTSSFQFRGGAHDILEIKKRLEVSALVEGSVRKQGQRLRITVQLIESSTGYVIWTDVFERPFKDVLAVQDEIAASIVEILRVQLREEPAKPQQHRPAGGVRGYSRYLKGLHHWSRRTDRELKKAIGCFKGSVDIDPEYAPAYGQLANCYVSLAISSAIAPSEVMPQAKAAALKALELDPGLPDAHASLAFVQAVYERDWESAERGFRFATHRTPRLPTSDHWYAIAYLLPMGELDEAIARLSLARQLDPLSAVVNAHMGVLLYMKGQYVEAIDQFRVALELDPEFYRAYWDLGRTYAQQSMFEDAVSAFARARELGGKSSFRLGSLGYCLARWGKTKEAFAVINELESFSKTEDGTAYDMAEIFLGLNDKDRALELLERADEHRSPWLVRLGVDPIFEPIRDDPGYAKLLGRMRLTHRQAIPAGP